MKKYEFTDETKLVHLIDRSVVLHRIRAVMSFGDVKAGDIGGWIETEENLSHDGNAWVAENAQVYDNAQVSDNAVVFGNAQVHSSAQVFQNAKVYGNAWVRGQARIFGYANVYHKAQIFDVAWIYGHAEVYGYAKVFGDATLCGDAMVHRTNHVFLVGPIGSRNDSTTFYRNIDGQIDVKCGCFNGNIEVFLEKVTQTHENNQHASAYRAVAQVAKMQIETDGFD